MRWPSIVLAIVGGIGLLFVVAGVVLVKASDTPDQALAAAASVPLVTEVSAVAQGTRVVVEGRVASDVPPVFEGFVAVTKRRFIGREQSGSSKGRDKWSTTTLAPSLRVGAVTVAEGYRLEGCHKREIDALTLGLNVPHDYATGVTVGDVVTAVGVTTPHGLTAEFVTCGERAAWLASVKENAGTARLLGAIFLCVGALALLIGVTVFVVGRRATAQ